MSVLIPPSGAGVEILGYLHVASVGTGTTVDWSIDFKDYGWIRILGHIGLYAGAAGITNLASIGVVGGSATFKTMLRDKTSTSDANLYDGTKLRLGTIAVDTTGGTVEPDFLIMDIIRINNNTLSGWWNFRLNTYRAAISGFYGGEGTCYVSGGGGYTGLRLDSGGVQQWKTSTKLKAFGISKELWSS